MYPTKSHEFFAGSVHLVYAVVAAQGFFLVSKLFVPIDRIYTFDGLMQGVSLSFVYFLLTTGWYGFFKSTKLFKHTISRKGVARYGLGLLNVFILYYMITLTATDDGTKYREIFWLVPVFYFIMAVAHVIKYLEYRKYPIAEEPDQGPPNLSLLRTQMVITGIFTVGLILIAMTYDYCIVNLVDFKWANSSAWNIVFIVAITCIVLWFRSIMWVNEKEAEKNDGKIPSGK